LKDSFFSFYHLRYQQILDRNLAGKFETALRERERNALHGNSKLGSFAGILMELIATVRIKGHGIQR